MIKTLREIIKEPFWSAGQKYGWEGSRTGIGLNVLHFEGLNDEDILQVKIQITKNEAGDYQIQKAKARELGKKYNCFFRAKDGTRLIVLPLSEFTRIGRRENDNNTELQAPVRLRTRLDPPEENNNQPKTVMMPA